MDQRAIEDLRRLAARDEELSARERRLQAGDAEVRELRELAEALEAFFARYDETERRVRTAVEAAEQDLARRRAEVADAEAALAAERDEERRELARRAVTRAEDHVSVAEASLARARAEAAQVERDAADWERELPRLDERANRLSADVPGVEPPGPGGEALIAWASHAHAELFVAVRQLEAERERVIREANELASALLGEPTYGSTVTQALARVEQLA